MILAISKNSGELWISSPRRKRRNDFLAAVLSWPADAIQPRSLITHPDAHTETHTEEMHARTHTYTLRRCVLFESLQNILWRMKERKGFLQETVAMYLLFPHWNVSAVELRSHLCMRRAAWQYVNVVSVCRALQAFCSAHRWLQWAFMRAHRVNEATRQAQQMLHKWDLGCDI